MFTFFYACTCGKFSRDKKRARALELGSERLVKEFDVAKFVRSWRLLASISRLLLTKEERRLSKIQRRDSVLNLAAQVSESSEDN